MYEKFKSYINRYYWAFYIIMAGIACAICWIIYGGSSDNSSAVEHLERDQDQQHKSAELNQTITDSVERSVQFNRQASERIVRTQEYQRQAITRIDESAKRLDEAAAILERNEQLIKDVEQGYQTEQIDGRATTQTAEHVGSN